jgi:glycosyltransferase involved in cell wall biosynthesis
MRILLLAPCPFFQERGTPIAIKLAAEVLSREGHFLQILTYPEGEAIPIPKGSITRIRAVPGVRNIKPGPSWKKLVYDPLLLFKASELARKNRFDLVHAVEESVFIALVLKKIFRLPYVYDLDSSLSRQVAEKYPLMNPLKPIMGYFERKAIRESLGAVAVCRALEEEVLKCRPGHLVCRLEDITLLPEEEDKEIMSSPRLFQEAVIMYVGNLEKYQGIDLLIEGFQKALPKLGKARLVIIGGRESEIGTYQNRVKQMGLEGEVEFLGPKPVSELAYWLQQASILVSPRLAGNNTPMKIYSYLDSGRPVLATRLPTHTQVLDEEIAYLVSPDPESLAGGLVALLENAALRERLAQAAKKRVREEYCFEAYQKKLVDFYRKVEQKLSGQKISE